MTRYPLVYLRLAQKDLHDIFDYVALDNPHAARKLLDRFDSTLKRLTLFPHSGPLARDESLRAKGYRLLVIDDYLAFYLVKGDRIEIRRIIHGKRRYSFLL